MLSSLTSKYEEVVKQILEPGSQESLVVTNLRSELQLQQKYYLLKITRSRLECIIQVDSFKERFFYDSFLNTLALNEISSNDSHKLILVKRLASISREIEKGAALILLECQDSPEYSKIEQLENHYAQLIIALNKAGISKIESQVIRPDPLKNQKFLDFFAELNSFFEDNQEELSKTESSGIEKDFMQPFDYLNSDGLPKIEYFGKDPKAIKYGFSRDLRCILLALKQLAIRVEQLKKRFSLATNKELAEILCEIKEITGLYENLKREVSFRQLVVFKGLKSELVENLAKHFNSLLTFQGNTKTAYEWLELPFSATRQQLAHRWADIQLVYENKEQGLLFVLKKTVAEMLLNEYGRLIYDRFLEMDKDQNSSEKLRETFIESKEASLFGFLPQEPKTQALEKGFTTFGIKIKEFQNKVAMKLNGFQIHACVEAVIKQTEEALIALTESQNQYVNCRKKYYFSLIGIALSLIGDNINNLEELQELKNKIKINAEKERKLYEVENNISFQKLLNKVHSLKNIYNQVYQVKQKVKESLLSVAEKNKKNYQLEIIADKVLSELHKAVVVQYLPNLAVQVAGLMIERLFKSGYHRLALLEQKFLLETLTSDPGAKLKKSNKLSKEINKLPSKSIIAQSIEYIKQNLQQPLQILEFQNIRKQLKYFERYLTLGSGECMFFENNLSRFYIQQTAIDNLLVFVSKEHVITSDFYYFEEYMPDNKIAYNRSFAGKYFTTSVAAKQVITALILNTNVVKLHFNMLLTPTLITGIRPDRKLLLEHSKNVYKAFKEIKKALVNYPQNPVSDKLLQKGYTAECLEKISKDLSISNFGMDKMALGKAKIPGKFGWHKATFDFNNKTVINLKNELETYFSSLIKDMDSENFRDLNIRNAGVIFYLSLILDRIWVHNDFAKITTGNQNPFKFPAYLEIIQTYLGFTVYSDSTIPSFYKYNMLSINNIIVINKKAHFAELKLILQETGLSMRIEYWLSTGEILPDINLLLINTLITRQDLLRLASAQSAAVFRDYLKEVMLTKLRLCLKIIQQTFPVKQKMSHVLRASTSGISLSQPVCFNPDFSKDLLQINFKETLVPDPYKVVEPILSRIKKASGSFKEFAASNSQYLKIIYEEHLSALNLRLNIISSGLLKVNKNQDFAFLKEYVCGFSMNYVLFALFESKGNDQGLSSKQLEKIIRQLTGLTECGEKEADFYIQEIQKVLLSDKNYKLQLKQVYRILIKIIALKFLILTSPRPNSLFL